MDPTRVKNTIQKVDDPLKRQQNRKANHKRPSASWVAQVKSCDKKRSKATAEESLGAFEKHIERQKEIYRNLRRNRTQFDWYEMNSSISDSDSWAPEPVDNRVELKSMQYTDANPRERTKSWVENHSQVFEQNGEGEAVEERD